MDLASLELVDRVFQYLDQWKLPLSILLDLSKAFDTLDHHIMLGTVKYCGISNTPLKWFEIYVHDRQQYVDFDGIHSSTAYICTGVPQGSILWPLLFIVYMNGIHKASQNVNVILYADDTNLISHLCFFNSTLPIDNASIERVSEEINMELGNIQEWLNIDKLSLYVKKTKFTILSLSPAKYKQYISNFKINSETIANVSEFNFLWLTIDEHLNRKPHIQKISNKIARILGVMCRLIFFFTNAHPLRLV